MTQNNASQLKKSVDDFALDAVAPIWKSSLIGGLATIALGVILLVWPGQTLLVIAVVFGIQLLVWSGMLIAGALVFSGSGWNALLGVLVGLLLIVAGIATLRAPGRTLVLLALFLGAGWVVSGVVDVIAALMGYSPGSRWLLGLSGILSVVAGVIVMTFPVSSVGALALWGGIFMIFMGAVRVGLAFDYRSAANEALA